MNPLTRDGEATSALLIWLAAIAGVLQPRTRGPATLVLMVLVSRAHGAEYRRLEIEFLRLFDERTSVGRRVTDAQSALDAVEQRVRALEDQNPVFHDPTRLPGILAEYPDPDNDSGASG